jgi:hypothetical protein
VKYLSCDEVGEVAAEFALQVLPEPQRGQVAAHLSSCPGCRGEVEALNGIAARLVDLLPGTEPPLGFDRTVLVRVGLRRRPRTRALAIAVAAAVVVGMLQLGAELAFPRGSHPAAIAPSVVAVFRDGGVPVGTLATSGRTPWVHVTVHGAAVSGPVSCWLVGRDGSVETLGLFDLVHGSGSWAVPDPGGLGGYHQARLVDRAGRVVATAGWP